MYRTQFSSINTCSLFQFVHSCAGTEFLILRTLVFNNGGGGGGGGGGSKFSS